MLGRKKISPRAQKQYPKIATLLPIWGQCYDHNFRQFSTIFGEKIGVFLKNQCYDQFFAQFSFVLSQKRQLFRNFFRQKYLKKIITSVPGHTAYSQLVERNIYLQNCHRQLL
jgi:hypothetical protein